MRINWLTVILVLMLAIIGFTYIYSASTYDGPSFIEEPVQENLSPAESITIDGGAGPVDLKLLATYEISAIVKSTKNYSSDYSSQISPRDFALAWADINKPVIDRDVSYSQRNRWYYFTVEGDAIVDVNYVDKHSANTHIIPANETVELLIGRIEEDDYITLSGYLVNVSFKNGYWNTSLTRDDTGDGSCEIMYVTDVKIHD